MSLHQGCYQRRQAIHIHYQTLFSIQRGEHCKQHNDKYLVPCAYCTFQSQQAQCPKGSICTLEGMYFLAQDSELFWCQYGTPFRFRFGYFGCLWAHGTRKLSWNGANGRKTNERRDSANGEKTHQQISNQAGRQSAYSKSAIVATKLNRISSRSNCLLIYICMGEAVNMVDLSSI